jgi:hypothetical protein
MVEAKTDLIRAGELSGTIRHALAFAIEQSQQKDAWVWPATVNDQAPASNCTGHLPMGQLVAIPADVDLCQLGLSPAGLVVARALQDYGAYPVASRETRIRRVAKWPDEAKLAPGGCSG